MGKFLSQDPVFLGMGVDTRTAIVLTNPQLHNAYAYAVNNPIKQTDTTGEFFDIFIDAGFTLYSTYKLGEAILTGGDVRGEALNLALDAGGAFIPGAVGLGTIKRATNAVDAGVDLTRGADITKIKGDITSPYKRPTNATTPQQRASVQGKACVDCGKVDSTMTADHKTPLVKEYYETGTINTTKMRDVGSVQPQCTNCSSRQGGELSNFSKSAKQELGL